MPRSTVPSPTEALKLCRFVFDCPACDAEVVVDDDVRSEILAGGCVICRCSVDAGAFAPLSEADVESDTIG